MWLPCVTCIVFLLDSLALRIKFIFDKITVKEENNQNTTIIQEARIVEFEEEDPEDDLRLSNESKENEKDNNNYDGIDVGAHNDSVQET